MMNKKLIEQWTINGSQKHWIHVWHEWGDEFNHQFFFKIMNESGYTESFEHTFSKDQFIEIFEELSIEDENWKIIPEVSLGDAKTKVKLLTEE